MKKIRMYLGIPSTGERADAQCYILRELQERYGDRIEFVYPKTLVTRIFHDFARNGIVEEFLESGCDVLWFLDSDVVPPRHVLELITCHYDKWQAAGAPYPVFLSQSGEDNRQVVYTVYEGLKGRGMAPANIPHEGTKFVDGIATGCIFVKREVFEKLNKPYFEFKYNEESRELEQGEDLGFCMKLSKLGIKFFVDFSMVCKHIKKLCLLEVNNYAMIYAQKAVHAYDAQIKEQVKAAVMAALQQGKEAGRREALEERQGIKTTRSGLILPRV